jgi:hypothetical protein
MVRQQHTAGGPWWFRTVIGAEDGGAGDAELMSNGIKLGEAFPPLNRSGPNTSSEQRCYAAPLDS